MHPGTFVCKVPSLRYLDIFNVLLAGDNCLKVTNRNKQGERITAKLYIVSVSCTESLNILCEAPGSYVNRIFLVFHLNVLCKYIHWWLILRFCKVLKLKYTD